MSASLVGSEMCIRDSKNNGHTTNMGFYSSANLLEGNIRAAKVLRDCLLYTSDAADDMSV
eukprot:14551995-Alexandrium_andersonii.AAC.1